MNATSPFLAPSSQERGGEVSFFGHQIWVFCILPVKMSDIFALPFKPYLHAGREYEDFWNSEHLFVFEVFSTAPLKERAGIVQSQWQLKQRVLKALAGKRCTTPAFLSEVGQAVLPSQQEAGRLRKAKQCVFVDHRLCECPLQKAKRMRVRPPFGRGGGYVRTGNIHPVLSPIIAGQEGGGHAGCTPGKHTL